MINAIATLSILKVAQGVYGTPGAVAVAQLFDQPKMHVERAAAQPPAAGVSVIVANAVMYVFYTTALFHVDMLVLVIWPFYSSNWIFQCPEWLTPMRRLDSRAKASLHSSILHIREVRIFNRVPPFAFPRLRGQQMFLCILLTTLHALQSGVRTATE